MQLNFDGLIIALITLLAIAFGHVFVRRGFQWFGKRLWPFSLVIGLVLLLSSLLFSNVFDSSALAVWGATFLWAVKEIFEKEERSRSGANVRC